MGKGRIKVDSRMLRHLLLLPDEYRDRKLCIETDEAGHLMMVLEVESKSLEETSGEPPTLLPLYKAVETTDGQRAYVFERFADC